MQRAETRVRPKRESMLSSVQARSFLNAQERQMIAKAIQESGMSMTEWTQRAWVCVVANGIKLKR